MSKIGSVVSALVSRRSYGVYARAVNAQASAAEAAVSMAETTDVAAAERATATKKQEKFWMRDPKTGCWVPENRFEEVDVVDLRNRMTTRHN